MLDNNKRKELLSKARQAGFPGSILDVFSAYEQGRDLIAEYQQEKKMKQAQQMSDFVASQTLQQPQMQQPQQAQQQLPSSPPVVQANVPVQMPEQQQPLVDSSRSTNVGIVPNQTGSYKGEAIFAKGGFKKDPLPKAKNGLPPKDYPIATPPPAWMPIYTLNPVEVKAKSTNNNNLPKGLPGNPYSQKEADAIEAAEKKAREDAYWKQWEETAYGRIEPTMGPIEAALGLYAFGPALGATFGTELLGTGVTVGNIVNPLFAAHGVSNFANPESDFRQALSRYNQGEGDWRDVAFEGGLNALNFLGAKSLPGDIKALSNARAPRLAKYNPWAWEPNANSFYHRNSNLENVVNPETGMLQSWAESAAGKAYTETNLNKTGLKFKKGAKGNMSFSKGIPLDGVYTNNKYPGPYLIEVSGETVPFRESVKGSPVSDVPGKIIGSYNVPGRPIALSEAKFYKEHPIWGYKPIEMPIQTPPGFQNRIFNSNMQLGEFKGIGHLSEPGYTYRTVGTGEIDAIRNTKGVFPRSGKAKGGNENVKYWTKGNGKNWYGENPEQQVIRVRDSKLLKDKVVNSKDVEVYNHSTGKFEPIHKKAKGGFKRVAKCYTCKANKLQVQYNNAKYKK